MNMGGEPSKKAPCHEDTLKNRCGGGRIATLLAQSFKNACTLGDCSIGTSNRHFNCDACLKTSRRESWLISSEASTPNTTDAQSSPSVQENKILIQRKTLQLVTENELTNWKAHLDLGVLLLDKPIDNEGAKNHLQKAMDLNPACIEAYIRLAYILVGQGKYDEAISVYEKALQIHDRNAALWTGLGYAFSASRQTDKAYKAYFAAVACDPYFDVPCYNLGNMLFDAGKFREAQIMFLRCVAVEPRHADAFYNLALCYQHLHDFPNSKKYFQKAATIEFFSAFVDDSKDSETGSIDYSQSNANIKYLTTPYKHL